MYVATTEEYPRMRHQGPGARGQNVPAGVKSCKKTKELAEG